MTKTFIPTWFRRRARKRLLLVLGGAWHDFDGFAAAMTPLFEASGYTVEPTYDLEALADLEQGRYDLVALYTCLGAQGASGAEGLTDLQTKGLVRWVCQGGALLALHAATVLGQSSPALGALIGGVFISHPPACAFVVYPCFRAHPITEGIQAFTVYDELYMQVQAPSAEVHMVALDDDVAYPMVWSQTVGEGRTAHIALGHDERVWGLESYQRLVTQAADWLTGQEAR